MLRNTIVLLFAFFLLVLPPTSAIGLAYSRDVLSTIYRPNAELSLQYYVLSHGERYAAVSVSGDFAQYATYDKLVPITGQLTPFTVKYVFPPAHKPGVFEAAITATQASPNGDGELSYVVGATAPLQIRVLDPDAYFELTGFHAVPENAKQGENITFTLSGTNYGLKNISQARANVDIMYNGENIATLTTNEKKIQSERGAPFDLLWKTINQQIGEYAAKGRVIYDGKETPHRELRFYVGEEEVLLENHTRLFTNDSVNRFFLNILSHWNAPIDFSARLILQKEGKEFTASKTPTETLVPWMPTTIYGFLDTTGLPLGAYDLNITFFAGRKQDAFFSHAEVIEGKPHVLIKQIEKQIPAALTTSPIFLGLVGLIVVLIVINVLLLLFYRRKQ